MTCIYQAELLLLLAALSRSTIFPPHPPRFGRPAVMNISDIRTRIESSEKGSLVTRIAELEETPVLTLVDTAERSEAETLPDPLIQVLDEMPDPLIQALVKKLPKPNSIWCLEDRAKWLRAAAIIFNLVYKPGEADSKTEETPSVLKSAG
jgi:hypothetical protein